MIKKLKRRYLITNMALLSSTLIVCLAVLFGFLYHSEVTSSYSVLQEMMNEPALPAPPPDQPPPDPTAQSANPELTPLSAAAVHYPPPYWDIPESEQNGGRGDDAFQWGYWWDPWQPPAWNPESSSDDSTQQLPEQTAPQNTLPPPNSEPEQTLTRTKPEGSDFRKTEKTQPEPPQTTEPRQSDPERETRPPRDDIPSANSTRQPSAEQGTTVTTTVAGIPPKGSVETQTTPAAPLVPVQEGHFIPDAFVAQIDSDGKIEAYAGNDTNVSDDDHFRTVHRAVDEVQRRGASAGTVEIGASSYRYLYQPDETGSYRLVLLDRTLELSTISKLLFIFFLITIVGLLMMFGISVLLANWTVTPIAVAWEKQKQFVADASHELKTPLAVISANTEVILSDPTQSVAGQSKWLNYIQSETMRMSKLITNLLSVARMDSGKQRESLKPLALSETVSNICLVFEPIIYENGKTLNTIIQRNVTMPAEEDNIKQLLSILLDNAVLHSVPKAQITVSLTKDTQGKIRLTVANTANDIPADQLARLFDRFYRIDTEGSPNGSGLGLSIAKSIVHQMGGNLTVTSENQLVTFVAVFSS